MKKIKTLILIAGISFMSLISQAQPNTFRNGDGSNIGSTPVGSNGPGGGSGAPIDNGVTILLAMGLVYGITKVVSLKKQTINT